jgi:hypothetical protein
MSENAMPLTPDRPASGTIYEMLDRQMVWRPGCERGSAARGVHRSEPWQTSVTHAADTTPDVIVSAIFFLPLRSLLFSSLLST